MAAAPITIGPVAFSQAAVSYVRLRSGLKDEEIASVISTDLEGLKRVDDGDIDLTVNQWFSICREFPDSAEHTRLQVESLRGMMNHMHLEWLKFVSAKPY